MEKKDTMIKDALILCAITLIFGAILAGVYAVTKTPIENAQAKANNEACAAVVASGDSVQEMQMKAKICRRQMNTLANMICPTRKYPMRDLPAQTCGDLQKYTPTQNGGTVYLANAKKVTAVTSDSPLV